MVVVIVLSWHTLEKQSQLTQEIAYYESGQNIRQGYVVEIKETNLQVCDEEIGLISVEYGEHGRNIDLGQLVVYRLNYGGITGDLIGVVSL